MIRILPFILLSAACAPAVPMHNCSEDFRDQWWSIDQEVLDQHNLSSACFIISSDGYMETVHYDSNISMESKWTCTGTNDLRIKGRGTAQFYPTEDLELWEVDLNLTIPPINETSIVQPCWWN